METSQFLTSIQDIHQQALSCGLYFQTCSDTQLTGREVTVGGRKVVSFSSCSYLGLEQHPAVIAGVHDAVERYGAQFSCSRGYLSAPIYNDIELRLSAIFEAPVLVTPSTTMAHMIALPVLADERDAIVLDHQAHHSIHMGTNQARAHGTTVEMVRHDQLERACEVVRHLATKKRTVWFCADGVFSMYGDLAPRALLHEILAVAPNVRLYIDDAHGMSWAGKHGRGSFLDRFPMNDRIVLATSFAKGFGAGGGCLVFNNPEERDRVRLCGGPFVFSGPMQPPMMGAVKASADLHLSPEITVLQQELENRTNFVNERLVANGLRPLAINGSPIFFLLCGLPRVSFRVAEKLLDEGVYVNCSVYPTVPMRRAGIRFTITASHSYEELAHAIDALAHHIPATLDEEGLSDATLAAMFQAAVPAEAAGSLPVNTQGIEIESVSRRIPPRQAGTYTVETAESIEAMDRNSWNEALGAAANCSWDAMVALERIYRRPHARPEHRWDFRYVVVRDTAGKVVGTTFLTTLLNKDDMLSREAVSRAVEVRRLDDPYFLTSKVVQFGSNLSEGNHLYLDRDANWRAVLGQMLRIAHEEVDRQGATGLIVRDLPAGDSEMDAFMLNQGLNRFPMFDSHVLPITWTSLAEWHRWLPSSKRRQLRETKAGLGAFSVTLHGHGLAPLAIDEITYLHELYRQLASRKLRLNVFGFPDHLIPELLTSPAWEFGVVRLAAESGGPADGKPVAFWAAHKHAGHYAPLFCGLIDAYVLSHESYRSMLWKILERSLELKMKLLHLGMDAELEKRRFGATVVKTCLYAQFRETDNATLLHAISESVMDGDGSVLEVPAPQR